MIPSDNSLTSSQNNEPTPKSKKKTKTNMRRMNIRVDDINESTKTWLANQKNVSASIRLLIDQASRQSVDDYITHCASLVGPPNQPRQNDSISFDQMAHELGYKEILETEEMPLVDHHENDLDLLDTDDNEEVEKESYIIEETRQEIIGPVVENVQEVPVQQAFESIDSETENDTVNAEEDGDDDDDDGVTARLLNDRLRKRKRNVPVVGASFEDIMISESQNDE